MLPLVDHLGFYALYLFVDALAVPLASTLYVAYMGSRHAPLLVAGIAAVATTAGSIAQYLIVRWLIAHPALQWPWLVRLRTRIVAAVGQGGNATFWALFIIYATPLGAGPMRLVAAVAGYPLARFAGAILLGSVPFYIAVAYLGHVVRLPLWAYGAMILAMIAFMLVAFRMRRG